MKKFLTTISLLPFAALVGSIALSASSVSAKNAPAVCTIQTVNGRYLTAVGGGGRISDVIHSDATQIRSWEKFTLEDLDLGTPSITYGIKTVKGHYLTAVGGGGRTNDVIHSDATRPLGWEQFSVESVGYGWYAIKTVKGNYLTAVGGGGRISDVIHSNATKVGSWEKFKFVCGL